MNNDFGLIWGKIPMPIIATIGAIDDEECNILRIGLNAMQIDNTIHTNKYDDLMVGFNEKTAIVHVYNAWGINKMERNNIRISKALANRLNCSIGDDIEILDAVTIHDNAITLHDKYTIDIHMTISINLLTETLQRTNDTDTIERTIAIGNIQNINTVRLYLDMFTNGVEQELNERTK